MWGNIQQRFAILMLMVALLFGSVFTWIWVPQIRDMVINIQKREIDTQLEVLGDGILPFLLQRQYAAVYETMQSVQDRHPDWPVLEVYLADGARLYPLTEPAAPGNDNVSVHEVTISLRGEDLAYIRAVVSLQGVVQSLSRQTDGLIILFGVIFAGGILSQALLLGMLVRRRAKLLLQAANEVARGNFRAALPPETDDEIGQLSAGFSAMRDQIEDKEKSLIAARERAEAAATAKTQFLATMSHEIRTPLNGVIPMAQLLADSELTPEQRHCVDVIQTSASALQTIIEDILDFSKLEAGRLVLRNDGFSLSDLMKEVGHMLSPQAFAQGLQLAVKIDPNVPDKIVGDKARVRQVLINLVGNAIKFTDRGRVRMHARLAEGGDTIELRVLDTGIGIPKEDQKVIFDRFSQVDSSDNRRFQGTGLGLAICSELVRHMGGQIGVKSRLGHGSIFWVHLPLVTMPELVAPVSFEICETCDLPVEEFLDILIVDDNALNLDVVSAVLAAMGHKATTVTGGRKAVEMVKTHKFDLVLMDLQMPDMNGVQATEAIRRLPPPRNSVPIVGLSASTSDQDSAVALAAGMDSFLSKPLSRPKLEAVLRRLHCAIPAGATGPAPETCQGASAHQA